MKRAASLIVAGERGKQGSKQQASEWRTLNTPGAKSSDLYDVFMGSWKTYLQTYDTESYGINLK